MKKLLFDLLFVTSLAFAQFIANWPLSSPSPTQAYIFAAFILLIAILPLIIVLKEKSNREDLPNYHFRENFRDDEID